MRRGRPPDNRDPHPNEIESVEDDLASQGPADRARRDLHAGQLLDQAAARRQHRHFLGRHGQEEDADHRLRAVRLYPLFHPAAALYTPSMLQTLRADFQRLPELLALGLLAQPQAAEAMPEPEPELEEPEALPQPEEPPAAPEWEPAAQLGLF